MLTITALWGACFVAIRWGLRDAPALWYAALRGLVAGAVLAGYAALRDHRLPRLGLRGTLTVSALALANVTLAFGAMFVATEGTVTGIAAVLSNAQPLLILLPAWVLYGERADAQTVAFMGLGLIGVLLLADGGGSGALLALLAAVGITAGTLLIRQLDGLDLVVVSAGHFLLGGAVLVGLAALLEGPPAIAWTPRFLASLAFLTLLGTAVAFVLWFEEARRAPLAAVSTWTLLVPVFGVAFGAVLLGERLAARELVGVVTVVLGVATVQARQQWQSRRAAVPSGRDHDGTSPNTVQLELHAWYSPGDREVKVPRAGWVKPTSDQRLSDHVALGVLTRTFPPALVDAVLADTGRTEQRSRLLPARLVVYYVMGLALFSSSSYEEVMRNLVEGLSWESGWRQSWQVPSKSAIFQARARLGVEPLQRLFERGCVALGTSATPGSFYRSWRLVAIDGTCLDVADTPDNDAAFGRPGASRGSSAFPQVRLVGLAECGTHAITGAAIGAYAESEQTLTRQLLGQLGPGMLCLADRGFAGVPLFDAAQATGADLLWRAKSNAVLPVLERFDDGSFRSEIVATPDKRTRANVLSVRVIEYTLEDPGRPGTPERYRLITTILDPLAAPADELAALYAQRWEFETALDEVKTHQRGPRVVLRSKTPDGVRQEIYGYLCTHYAIRVLMATAADDADVDPDRISFTRSLRAARRSIRAGIGTTITALTVALGDTITEIVHELLPVRRLRTAARVVKRKMSNYGVKRPEHRTPPRPTLAPPDALHVLAPP